MSRYTTADVRYARRPWSLVQSLAITAFVTMIAVWADRSEILTPVDHIFTNGALLAVRPEVEPEPVVLVAIDDASLGELGRWPWPRRLQARLLGMLNDAQVVAYNIAIIEPNIGDPDGDNLLVAAIRAHGNVVMPLVVTETATGTMEVPPAPAFVGAARRIGHVVLEADSDGTLRRLQLFGGSHEPLIPAFALATSLIATGEDAPYSPELGGKSVGWQRSSTVLLPLGTLQASVRFVPAVDILKGRAQPDLWTDRTVVVSVTAKGIGTVWHVPAGARTRPMTGGEVQARAVQALSARAMVFPTSGWDSAIFVVVTCLLSGALFLANARWLLVLVVGAVIPLLGALILLEVLAVWVPPTSPLLASLFFALLQGIGARQAHRRQLDAARRRADTILHAIDSAVITIDGSGCISFANPGAERLFGATREAIEGAPAATIFRIGEDNTENAKKPPGQSSTAIAKSAKFDDALGIAASQQLTQLVLGSGESRTVRATRVQLPDWDGGTGEELVAITDVSELARLHVELERRATHDLVTGLPNRQFVDEYLALAMGHGRRDGTDLAVLLVDLDHFKDVNDRFGHRVGDELLRAVGRRLAQNCRSEDLVGRIGGDEFVIVAGGLLERDYGPVLAEKLLQAFAQPVIFAERSLHVELSIGISCLTDGPEDPDSFIGRADLAMYQAKHRRGAYRMFSAKLEEAAREELELRHELRHAVECAEFDLYFQPRVQLASRSITGFEALLRWRRPNGTSVSPAIFVPIAENAGLLEAITEWVVERALNQLQQWRKQHNRSFTMSINISARHILDPTLVDFITNSLARANIPPTELVLEITESTLMQQPEKSIGVLRQLQQAGIRIAIDDFGTGYSSLAYLRDLPIDEIKIDRSFSARIGIDERDDLIVTAISRMAQSLKIDVVAEGVERLNQAVFFTSLGVDQAQGFLYSRPIPAAAIDDLLARGAIVPIG